MREDELHALAEIELRLRYDDPELALLLDMRPHTRVARLLARCRRPLPARIAALVSLVAMVALLPVSVFGAFVASAGLAWWLVSLHDRRSLALQRLVGRLLMKRAATGTQPASPAG